MAMRKPRRSGGNRRRPSRSTEAKRVHKTAQEFNFAILRLKSIQAVVVTAAAALWHQNADHDADIGRCLQFAAVDPLQTEIERLERLTSKGNAQ